MIDKLILAGAVLLLAACAAPQKKSRMQNLSDWQVHQRQLEKLRSWNVQGRVSVATRDNGGQADIFWSQQDNQHYDIKMVAPFGSGTSYVQGRPQGVVLTTSSGEQFADRNADALFQQVQGWNFPVSGLRYWLLGIPSPHSQFKLLDLTENGQLAVLEQDGWRIEMRRYQQVNQFSLPKKVFITREDDEELDVRMVIRKWDLAL